MKRNKLCLFLLVFCMVCSLTACGGTSNSDSDSGMDYKEDDKEDDKVEVVPEDAICTGSVIYDANGDISEINQFFYDEEGNLISQRIGFENWVEYGEMKFTPEGFLESLFWYDENGNKTNGYEYIYERDENGRIIKREERGFDQTEPAATYIITYSNDGKLEKEQGYDADGQLFREGVFYAAGIYSEIYNYSEGNLEAYSLFEYNEQGDLILARYGGQYEVGERVNTYVNTYDEKGNKLFVTKYNEDSQIIGKEIFAYAEPSDSYTVQDIKEQATEILNRYNQAEGGSEVENRDASIVISSGRVSCIVEYESQVVELETVDMHEEKELPAAYISHLSMGDGTVVFYMIEETVEEMHQEHMDVLEEYRTDIWVSDVEKYTTEDGTIYESFSSRSTARNWGVCELTLIYIQVTEDIMIELAFNKVLDTSLEEFVESSFYITEITEIPKETQSDNVETEGSIIITWDSEVTDLITGHPYDLQVLLQGNSDDGTAITCDADGKRYLDSQGNVVAIVQEIEGQITIEFYNTDVYYTVTIENNGAENGWTDYTTITCNLEGATEFDQWNHYYRGATGVWYFSFGIENGIPVLLN